MTVSPLLYVWGDDDLVAERIVMRFAAALERDLDSTLDRWDVTATAMTASTVAAQVHERLATPVMFGGGTLVVVSGPGHLVRRNADRDRIVEAIRIVAAGPGNAVAFIHARTPQDRVKKGEAAGPKRLWGAIADAGGSIRQASAPTPAGLGAWVADEARDRGIAMAPGAARALADRLGARVTQGDVDRRFLSRIASNELDKLSLRHVDDDQPITPDDIEALVASSEPASIWALTDAVGERNRDAAIVALDRLVDTTPEPVLLAALHRRLVEILAMRGTTMANRRIPESAQALGIRSPFVAERAMRLSRGWDDAELADAVSGLVELDAAMRGAHERPMDKAQWRLALTMWVHEHLVRTRPD
jgi:DNA polymerase III delta subunit